MKLITDTAAEAHYPGLGHAQVVVNTERKLGADTAYVTFRIRLEHPVEVEQAEGMPIRLEAGYYNLLMTRTGLLNAIEVARKQPEDTIPPRFNWKNPINWLLPWRWCPSIWERFLAL